MGGRSSIFQINPLPQGKHELWSRLAQPAFSAAKSSPQKAKKSLELEHPFAGNPDLSSSLSDTNYLPSVSERTSLITHMQNAEVAEQLRVAANVASSSRCNSAPARSGAAVLAEHVPARSGAAVAEHDVVRDFSDTGRRLRRWGTGRRARSGAAVAEMGDGAEVLVEQGGTSRTFLRSRSDGGGIILSQSTRTDAAEQSRGPHEKIGAAAPAPTPNQKSGLGRGGSSYVLTLTFWSLAALLVLVSFVGLLLAMAHGQYQAHTIRLGDGSSSLKPTIHPGGSFLASSNIFPAVQSGSPSLVGPTSPGSAGGPGTGAHEDPPAQQVVVGVAPPVVVTVVGTTSNGAGPITVIGPAPLLVVPTPPDTTPQKEPPYSEDPTGAATSSTTAPGEAISSTEIHPGPGAGAVSGISISQPEPPRQPTVTTPVGLGTRDNFFNPASVPDEESPAPLPPVPPTSSLPPPLLHSREEGAHGENEHEEGSPPGRPPRGHDGGGWQIGTGKCWLIRIGPVSDRCQTSTTCHRVMSRRMHSPCPCHHAMMSDAQSCRMHSLDRNSSSGKVPLGPPFFPHDASVH